MPSIPKRETMSSLLATHTAIRVARDVGYPPLQVPAPPTPQAYYVLPEPSDELAEIPAPIRTPRRPAFSPQVFGFLLGIAFVLAIVSTVIWINYLFYSAPLPG